MTNRTALHGLGPARAETLDGPRDFFVEKIADAVAERLTKIHGRRKRLFDLDEAAEYLCLSEDAVRDLVAQGKLKPVRPTRKVQFDVYDLDQLIDNLK